MYAVGENLARLRNGRGLSQTELATASGVAADTISRLERDPTRTPRQTTLAALAEALGVSTTRLLGMVPPEQETEAAEQLRRAVRALDLPEIAEHDDPPPLAELHAAVSGAWADYLAGRQAEMLVTLPVLMGDARNAVHALADDHAAEAAGLLATAYRLATGLAGRLGLVDLAAHAAHRALDTAAHSTSPDLDTAAALRYLVWVLVRQGDAVGAERLALRSAAALDGGLMARPDPGKVAVFGALMGNAANAAGRQGSSGRGAEHLAVASAAAVRSGVDRIDEVGVFGPRVTAMQGVELAMRTGDPERAIDLATRVPPTHGAVPSFWEAGHRLHLAAACDDLDRWGDVAQHLAAARDIAPQWARLQPLGQVLTTHLVEHRGRRAEAVATLADHYLAPID